MAYPQYPFYQNPYGPYMYQQTPYQAQPAQQPAQTPSPTPQIQNGGFVSVRNIDEARNWPIAPGNSITFKDESAPYIYTKTMSYNQLDTPRFERFRLVREDDAPQTPGNAPASAPSAPTFNPSDFVTQAEFAALRGDVEAVKAQIDETTARKTPPRVKKEEKGDE